MWSWYSSGAAPVPPSDPSTMMKSGRMPVSCIALHIARTSTRVPMHSLKPTGLPSDSSRSRPMNSMSCRGVENAECPGGEMQSWKAGTPRMCAISSVTLGAGRTPPSPGLAPCDSFTLIIFTWGWSAFFRNSSGEKSPSRVRHPK